MGTRDHSELFGRIWYGIYLALNIRCAWACRHCEKIASDCGIATTGIVT